MKAENYGWDCPNCHSWRRRHLLTVVGSEPPDDCKECRTNTALMGYLEELCEEVEMLRGREAYMTDMNERLEALNLARKVLREWGLREWGER